MHSDRRTRVGREDERGNRVQITLAVDYRLLERLDAAARHRATSRVALIAAWLAEKLGQEPHETGQPR
jgi:hypothetical protein